MLERLKSTLYNGAFYSWTREHVNRAVPLYPTTYGWEDLFCISEQITTTIIIEGDLT